MRLLYNPFVRFVILVVSGVLNWYAFVWIATKMGIHRPEFEATALLVAVLVHELAHATAMWRHGIKSVVFFAVILGGTSPLDMDEFDKLRDGRKAEIMIAGLFGNVAVGCAAVVLGAMRYLTQVEVDYVLNMNAALVLFNMVPILGFDGSRFIRLLFHNINPDWDVPLFELTAAPVAVAMMVLLYIKGSVTIAIPLILVELFFKSRHHDTSVRGTMNREEQIYWGIVYATICVAAIVVFTHTNTWNRI